MKLRHLGEFAVVAALAFSACNQPGASGGTSKGSVKFAVELPFQGSEKAASDPIINGIKLAIKQAGGQAGGYTIDLPASAIYDDAINGAHDPQTGANNMSQIVGDDSYVGVLFPNELGRCRVNFCRVQFQHVCPRAAVRTCRCCPAM